MPLVQKTGWLLRTAAKIKIHSYQESTPVRALSSVLFHEVCFGDSKESNM
jgi:hypothetical protein